MDARYLGNVTACFEALDRAIAIVAQEEFDNLRRGLSATEVTSKIAEALRGLGTLQDPNAAPPDYRDPWLVLCYILWYQPAQTYLAYRWLLQLARRRQSDSLQIVDFGCGALATEIALDIALTTEGITASRSSLDSACVASLDVSQEMIRFGESISRELLSDPDSPLLDHSLISMRILLDPDKLDFGFLTPDEDRWLTALHAVYGTNRLALKQQLKAIYNRVEPDWFVMTSHTSKRKWLREAAPIAGIKQQLVPHPAWQEQQALPDMANVSRVRGRIRSFASDTKLSPESADNVSLVMNYMRGIPNWMQSVQSTTCVVHQRSPEP